MVYVVNGVCNLNEVKPNQGMIGYDICIGIQYTHASHCGQYSGTSML